MRRVLSVKRESQEANRELEPADLVRSLEDLENLRASAEQLKNDTAFICELNEKNRVTHQ